MISLSAPCVQGYVDGAFTTVKCRLFQRGNGWCSMNICFESLIQIAQRYTLQRRAVIDNGEVLLEENILVCPDTDKPIVISRYFNRSSEIIPVATSQ